ncbi:MAG: DUF4834 family protein [Bacteroidetes bacterium]|nr:DUF4834 family protein [Bacteroidota bacterium]
MKDLFYTILIVWIIWRIFNGISTYKFKQTSNSASRSDHGKTTIDHMPPSKKKISDDEGEYVDYEEIK